MIHLGLYIIEPFVCIQTTLMALGSFQNDKTSTFHKINSLADMKKKIQFCRTMILINLS